MQLVLSIAPLIVMAVAGAFAVTDKVMEAALLAICGCGLQIVVTGMKKG